MRFLLTLSLLFMPAILCADIVSALSDEEINITATFSGAELFVYGAVKGTESEEPLDVIIVVEGPGEALTIRRKERIFGIWVNRDSAEIGKAPNFYSIAATAPIDGILDPLQDDHYNISFDQIFAHGAIESEEPEAYADAVLRLKSNEELYQLNERGVELIDNALFSTSVAMPSKVIEGPYTLRFYLVRDGRVVNFAIEDIRVSKVGVERWIYDLAQTQAPLYALLSLVIAISAGWLASFVFTRLFRG